MIDFLHALSHALIAICIILLVGRMFIQTRINKLYSKAIIQLQLSILRHLVDKITDKINKMPKKKKGRSNKKAYDKKYYIEHKKKKKAQMRAYYTAKHRKEKK